MEVERLGSSHVQILSISFPMCKGSLRAWVKKKGPDPKLN